MFGYLFRKSLIMNNNIIIKLIISLYCFFSGLIMGGQIHNNPQDAIAANKVKFMQFFAPPQHLVEEIEAHKDDIIKQYYEKKFDLWFPSKISDKLYYSGDSLESVIDAYVYNEIIKQNNLTSLAVAPRYVYIIDGKCLVFFENIGSFEQCSERNFTAHEFEQLIKFQEMAFFRCHERSFFDTFSISPLMVENGTNGKKITFILLYPYVPRSESDLMSTHGGVKHLKVYANKSNREILRKYLQKDDTKITLSDHLKRLKSFNVSGIDFEMIRNDL